MDIRKIELMKALQQEYYGELRRKNSSGYHSAQKGVLVSPQMLFFYRLCAAGMLGFSIPVIVTVLTRLLG